MVNEGGSLGDGPSCNKKKRWKKKEGEKREKERRRREGGRSIIAETGNILTGGWELNKIPRIIVSPFGEEDRSH